MSEPIDLQKARSATADRRQLVACAHCGRLIPTHSTRCPKCGVHFEGEAFMFGPDAAAVGSARLRKVALVVVGLIVAVGLVFSIAGLLIK